MLTSKLSKVCTSAIFGLVAMMIGASSYAGSEPNDARALHGLTSAKAIFDITTANPKKLYFYLNLIETTAKSMEAQGVKPKFVLAFRGPATFYMTSDRSKIKLEDAEIADKIEKKITELGRDPVLHLEQCAVAAHALHVDKKSIYRPIKVIGNSWISLIGYENRGYAIVPVR